MSCLTKGHLLFIFCLLKIQLKNMQMQGKINMNLPVCQLENGFSLDELVTKPAVVHEHKAVAELPDGKNVWQ